MNKILIVFLLLTGSLLAQGQYVFGPVKENSHEDWIKKGSETPTKWEVGHKVGSGSDGTTNWETRNINTWQWTLDKIPTNSTVTSVVISFIAQKYKPYQDFHFSLHSINYPRGTTDINFFNEFTVSNKIYDTTLIHNNGVVNFTKTFYPNDGGGVCGAINSAIQGAKCFFTLGIQQEGTQLSPYWLIHDTGCSDVEPAIYLTINFTTIPQSYQFINKIENTDTTGMLNVKNLSNGTSNNIISGTVLGLDPMYTYSARTNELPFWVNWKNTGNTEKYNYWTDNKGSHYIINYSLKPDLSKTEFKITANFDRTSSVTIQAAPTEGVTGMTVSMKDPWNYYSDGQGNWSQTNQFINYSSPKVIQNNSTSSYGGVILNQSPVPDNDSIPYYSVSFPSISSNQSVNAGGKSHPVYFLNWTASPSNSATFTDANATTTPVTFLSPGAIVTANIKASMLSSQFGAFANNSQKKVISIYTNQANMVYESMDRIWLEESSDNGNS